jgi:hypothetical protein
MATVHLECMSELKLRDNNAKAFKVHITALECRAIIKVSELEDKQEETMRINFSLDVKTSWLILLIKCPWVR